MIRKFENDDIEQVIKIWLNGNLEAHDFIPGEYWKEHIPDVRKQLLQAEIHVYEADGAVRGFVGMQEDYLAGIFVDNACRSMGIGRKLLDYVKSVHPAFSLDVYQRNRRAVSFYLREGLTIISGSAGEDSPCAEYTMEWRSCITIRPYREEDFERLEQVHDPARKEELALAQMPDAFIPLSVAAKREGLFTYQVYVAEYDGVVAGFVAFSEDEIAWLYVDPAYFGRGIAKELLRFTIPKTDDDVSIEVLAGNTPAIDLYSSFGFKIVETLSGSMPGNESFSVTVHVMKK